MSDLFHYKNLPATCKVYFASEEKLFFRNYPKCTCNKIEIER